MSNSDNKELIGQRIMHLLGMMPYDLNFPDKYEKLKTIERYFQGRSMQDVDYHILKIIDKRRPQIAQGYKALDIMWEYVGLKNSERETIESLPVEEFSPDIVQELNDKYLTNQTINKIKHDIELKKLDEQGKVEELKGVLQTKAEQGVMDTINNGLLQLENIKRQLEIYE